MMRIFQAQAADLNAILTLIDSAAKWLHRIGIDYQWEPEKVFRRREHFEALVEAEKFWVVQMEGKTVATFMLDWSDNDVWVDDNLAGYLGYFTVDRNFAGLDIGGRVLAWVEAQVVAKKRSLIRLDCVADNTNLNRYYQRQGFAAVGEFLYADGVRAVQYQKPVSSSTGL